MARIVLVEERNRVSHEVSAGSADARTPGSPSAPNVRRPSQGRRPLALLLGVALLVVVLDQVTKAIALQTLEGRGYVPLLGEYFGLVLVHNPGAAFGIASGATWVLALVTIVVVIAIFRLARTLTSPVWGVTLGMLLGGALGNLIDRLVREPGVLRGHVVDFLSYWDWFVGNVADIAIVAAALLMIVLTVRGIDPEGRAAAPAEADDA